MPGAVSKAPAFTFASVARGLRVPAHKIRITPLPHGGSFGTKIFPHAIIRMALLSRKAGGRHVKWIEDRVEHLLSSYTHGPDRIYSAEMALTRDGEITGFRVKVLDDLGAHAVSVAIGKALKPLSAFTGPYRMRNAQYDLTVVATNKCPQGSYRGWGVPAHNLAMEHCVDLAARKLDLDPVEIRRRNLLRPDQFPYEAPNGARYDSGDYERTLDMALELADYSALAPGTSSGSRRGSFGRNWRLYRCRAQRRGHEHVYTARSGRTVWHLDA